ncbi:Protein of unknown function [Agrococcus baldri]|uniref:DUF2470 domain-containing protein n=1 Tax=Agrococcus baldri TaxID=153730 RepID=A0AA94HMB9_9MICO|nr:DUF2470 domain-containing protein [Agrococcus baldri]SFS10155.1 Protein of unknown function [Agrococcus baldri]
MTFRYTDDVIEAVVHHMNGDHGDDQLAIVREHARPDAASATLVTLGADGLGFDVEVPEGPELVTERVTVAWPMPIAERADIRRAVVALMPRENTD